MIHAPFNFVPLSNDVYYPTWADQISLDIPFEKNYTGYLEFNITAKSPIFVRNGNSQKQNEAVRELCKLASSRLNNEIARTLHINGSLNHETLILNEMQKNKRKWEQKFTELLHEEATKAHNDLSNLFFSNIQNRYFLPSTSIKGCVRNALEILSFGKIKDRVSDDRYGFREMTGLYLNSMRVENIHCGYLVVRDGEITISDHGIPYRISHEALDSGIKNLNFVQEYGSFYSKNRDKKKSPKHKIDKLNTCKSLPTRFSEIGESFNRKLVVIDEKGLIEGSIVVTGQPGQRNFNNGKFYEFVFPKRSLKKYPDLEKGLLYLYQDFLFINKNEESGSWTTWENQLQKGEEVPVFFTVENDAVRDMGLSYMYKRPFRYRISDCIKQAYSDKPDLAECLFGRIKDDAFKGRVQFSNAFANNIKGEQLVERLILSSPKASYYPMYIKQSSHYLKSYQDDTAVISGWKKYPIRKNTSSKNMNNAKLDSFMIPLGKETTFTCRMNFFNLKGAELGALLSVLTFHGSTDDYYLSIGQGKPYGYGKIKITPTQLCINNELVTSDKIREKSNIFMQTFESNLVRTLHASNSKFLKWHDSDAVKEFYTMSYDALEASNSLLQYMELNDFPNCKRSKEYLHRFSEICRSSKAPKSLLPSK